MPVVIKLKGLPWAAASGDIKQFFRGSKLAEHDIHLAPSEDGKACGVGFACFYDDEDARKAMQHNGAYLGKRYIELFLSSQSEMEKALRDGMPRSTFIVQDRPERNQRISPNRGERSMDRVRDRSPQGHTSVNNFGSVSSRGQSMDDGRNGSSYGWQSRGGYDRERGFRGGVRGRGGTTGFRGGVRGASRGTTRGITRGTTSGATRGGATRGGATRGGATRGGATRGSSVRGGIRGNHSYSASKAQYNVDNRSLRDGVRSRPEPRGGSFFGSPKTQRQPSKGLQPIAAGATSSLFLKLSGLPFTADNATIINFFNGVNITAVHIIPNKNGPHVGKSSGDAFVECATQSDCVKALKKHGEYLGKRYLNVVRSTFEEIVSTLNIDLNLLTGQVTEFNTSDLDFPRSQSAKKPRYNLDIPSNQGSSSFPSNSQSNIDPGANENPAITQVAASANINLDDIKDGCVVGIRNLPTIATTEAIVRIFRDYRAIPDSVRIHYLDVNRCSGDAMITLVNNDAARRAIRQISGQQFGDRKIELFLL